MDDRVQCKIAELRKRQSEIALELQQLDTIAAKRQRCSNDVEEAICLLKSEFMDLRQVLDHFSNIGQRREFWDEFLRVKNEIGLVNNFPQLVLESAKPLLEDRDLVLKLCAYSAEVYFHLSDHLQQDEGILEVVVTSSPPNALFIPDEIQEMYPGHVALALDRLPLSTPYCQKHALEYIHASLWAHRIIALAWASAGGHFLERFPEEFNDDDEILVAFLQNDGGIQLRPTARLLADKQFMLRAVKAHPTFLAKVAKELACDWDLLLAAMSNPRIVFLDWHQLNLGGWVRPGQVDANEFWIDASKTVREKLCAHDIFVKLLLGGVMAPTGGSTPLTLLNQGKTASLAFMKPIAEYLGVPMGEELCMLREARKNLALIGIHWESSC
jgi:hypothetical protein